MFIGKTIDNYKMLEILGRGGMGTVYKALDTTLDNHVAVKMLNPNLSSDESFMKRFRTEARALARINDPNIVTVHALRETEFGMLMIMEYVEGMTLSDWLDNRANVSIKKLIPIFKQILRAVSHAHGLGIVHRDIKPGNILISKKNVVKITDFGLARLERGSDSTVTKVGGGTLQYMSPEQVKGLGNVTKQTDIYSVGMTFYEALAGRTPFQESDSEYSIIRSIVEKKFPAPTEYKTDLPKSLTNIVMKAIEKKEEKRFQSADEMLDALTRFEKEYNSLVRKPKLTPKKGISFWPPNRLYVFSFLALFLVIFFLFRSAQNDEPPVPDKIITFSLSTEPEAASVFFDDEFVGQTPFQDFPIDPGEYHVSIKKQTYFDFDTTLTITENSNADLDVSLQPCGILSFIVNPIDADFELNGRKYDISQLYNMRLLPGNYHIKASRAGYATIVDNIKLQHGDSLTEEYSLALLVPDKPTPKPKTPKIPPQKPYQEKVTKLIITTEPSGADVFVNRRFRGTSPITIDNLRPGSSYEIKITKPGYAELNEKVVLFDKPVNRRKYKLSSAIKHTITILAVKLDDGDRGGMHADIYVDGKATYFETPKDIELSEGTHIIELRKSGYLSNKKIVNVVRDDKVVFIMEKI